MRRAQATSNDGADDGGPPRPNARTSAAFVQHCARPDATTGDAPMRTRRRKTWQLAAVLATVGMIAAACGSDKDTDASSNDSGGSGKTVALAFVGALTGDSANLGINIRDGIKLALSQNKNTSTKVELKEFDTQGDPAQAS